MPTVCVALRTYYFLLTYLFLCLRSQKSERVVVGMQSGLVKRKGRRGLGSDSKGIGGRWGKGEREGEGEGGYLKR